MPLFPSRTALVCTLSVSRLPIAMVALLAVAISAPLAGAAEKAEVALSWAADVNHQVDTGFASLENLYTHLHLNPELSSQEERTAAYLARQLGGTGFEITRNVGGFGIVAVLKNGDGPTVLVRTEMDALPIEEKTGLPYASKVKARDGYGNLVSVMHACGHDVHMTCWIGAARSLAAMKDRWAGTLVFIAQPAEESGMGAYRMLNDGLFTKYPRPDYCLALHCDAEQPCGHIAFTPGLAMANIDMVDITVRGKGGHGAWPQLTIDPVVLSARLILDLQTLVSRENNPTDPLVITIGTIHGGVKANVIPNEVTLQLTVRTTRDLTRKRVLEGIARMAKAAASGAGAPEPILNIHPNCYTPAVVNDPKLLEKTIGTFRAAIGEGKVHQRPPMMGGEDFSLYGRAGVPSVLFFLGTQPAASLSAAEEDPNRPVPSLHSDRFAPVMEPTLKTGVLAMSLAVLDLVGTDSPNRPNELTRSISPLAPRATTQPASLGRLTAGINAQGLSKIR
jgi:hippurate hydrolase